jgi:hypothetical protein
VASFRTPELYSLYDIGAYLAIYDPTYDNTTYDCGFHTLWRDSRRASFAFLVVGLKRMFPAGSELWMEVMGGRSILLTRHRPSRM